MLFVLFGFFRMKFNVFFVLGFLFIVFVFSGFFLITFLDVIGNLVFVNVGGVSNIVIAFLFLNF